MAAQTLGSNYDSVLSQMRVQCGTVTTMANGDTVAFKSMKTIRAISFTPTTNVAFGFTFSGNVATLVAGSSLSGKIIAFGD